MQLIVEAWKDLKSYPLWVAVYVGVHALLTALTQGLDAVLSLGVDKANLPGWVPVYQMGSQFAFAAVVSALQAVVFARMGKTIDRPLWKCRDDREALRRFFMLWFIFNLGILVIAHLHSNAIENNADEIAILLEILDFCVAIAYLPVGICIMHWGGMEWPSLGLALRPMLRQITLSFTVMTLLVFQYAFFIISSKSIVYAFGVGPLPILPAVVLVPLLVLPMAFLEFLAFCAMWRVCMIYRQSGDDAGNDFDF